MSVVYFGQEEMGALLTKLLEAGAPLEPCRAMLQTLSAANRAAYLHTYKDIDPADAPGFVVQPGPVLALEWDAETHAKNLLYNCVANDGTDFAPRYAEASLLVWAKRRGIKAVQHG